MLTTASCAGTCSPVLEPEARWGDMWGMGWLNFHGKLVREVKRADEKEVRTRIVLAPGTCVSAAWDAVLPAVSDLSPCTWVS